MNFPDLPHLQQLQKDLWQWPKARAALMVGAGFSLNANPLPGITSRFPTWRQLVQTMFDQMYPAQPGESITDAEARRDKFNNTNPLRIASEYEAALGREKLDRLIRKQNPDSDHQPAELHRLLLELPWADVFTTNYDTLLERTEIPGRNFQPVVKASELTTSFSPRIIKLHGSFPAQTPFIISEEDYRTYPQLFAPFVNTVQQALLENSIVLLGFSGDDPNFLAWTGWIRDELGGNHAPIYLVGLLSLGNADRLLLDRRGVTPIDLSPLFQGKTPSSEIHHTSIEWFLKCLVAAKPPRPERWPEFVQNTTTLSASAIPIIGASERIPNDIGFHPDHFRPITNEIVSNLLIRWQFERRHYPGWIVLPDEKRSALWNDTKYWLTALYAFSKSWTVADRILLFGEINWRLETAMVPLFPESIEPFQQAVNEAFEVLNNGGALIHSSQISGVLSSATDAITAWMEIAFGLLREARETYDMTRWNEFKGKIDKIGSQQVRFVDRNHYEAALWAVWNVERDTAKSTVSLWQPSTRSPLASLRKAGLLAELDELGEARTILRSALWDVRRALRTQGQNIELLSLEGWITFLLFAVEQGQQFGKRNDIREEFWERWQDLKAWDCSPWIHIGDFESALAGAPPKFNEQAQEIHEFDPGHVSITRNFSSNVDKFLPAFACIRLFEQAGIPMRMPLINIAGREMLKNACNWIAPFIGFWSPALLVRAGNSDALIKNSLFLTRTKVAVMDLKLATRLHQWSLKILEKEMSSFGASIRTHTAQEALLRVLPEVISRLAARVDESELKQSFSLAFKCHNNPAVRCHPSFNKICDPWFKRLFEAADGNLFLEWLPDLIKAPLFEGTPHKYIPVGAIWPDPMNHFPYLQVRKAGNSRQDLVLKVQDATDWLLRRISSESGEGWQRAIFRLIRLFEGKLMTQPQVGRFTEELWSKTGPNSLPNLTDLAAFAYVLNFPAPQEIDVSGLVKSFVLSMAAKNAVGRDGNDRITISDAFAWSQSFIRETIIASKPIIQSFRGKSFGVEWTIEESKQNYEKAFNWWTHDKIALEKERQRTLSPFLGTNPVLIESKLIGEFLGKAVLPNMGWANETDWQQIIEWLKELRTFDVFPSEALPYVLLSRPQEAAVFMIIIENDLHSDIEEAVENAAEGVFHWVYLAALKRIPDIDQKLVKALIERVLFRRKQGISSCLSRLSFLLVEQPDLFSLSQIDTLIGCLQRKRYA